MDNSDIIIKPIVYGSVAFWLGKKADETVSHKWCVYVRGLNNEDISYFVKEVVFTLHSSFTNHVRTINKFPFELYEVGWGQFDIIITIYLKDETSKPIEFIHPLKLYPTQPHVSMSTKKPVVSESYDEIVFVNPEPKIREVLLNPPAAEDLSVHSSGIASVNNVINRGNTTLNALNMNSNAENISIGNTFQNQFENIDLHMDGESVRDGNVNLNLNANVNDTNSNMNMDVENTYTASARNWHLTETVSPGINGINQQHTNGIINPTSESGIGITQSFQHRIDNLNISDTIPMSVSMTLPQLEGEGGDIQNGVVGDHADSGSIHSTLIV